MNDDTTQRRLRRKRIMRLSLESLRDGLHLPKDVRIVAVRQLDDDMRSDQVSLCLEGDGFSDVAEGAMLPVVNAVYEETQGSPEFVEFSEQ